MFKKLIIAVLTLGLLLTFSSAAISSDTPKTGITPVEKFNPNAPKVNQAQEVPRPQPTFTKPINALNALQTPSQLVLPPDTFTWCEDYSGGAAAYFWRLTDIYGDSIMGMRFTSNENYACTLKTASIGIYGTAIKGNPGMRVFVFDDDGFGLPGTLQGYVDVAPASLPHSGLYYYTVDISSLGVVYSNGADFHIGVSKTGVAGDTLAILSDDGTAGDGRSWEYYGVYGTMAGDWGIDVNFLIEACAACARIPFTDCYTQSYNCGVAYFWTQPDAYGDDYFNMRFSVEGPETLKTVSIALYAPPTVGTPDLDVFIWGSDGMGFPNLGDLKASVTVPYSSLVFYPGYTVVDLSSLNLVMTEDFHVGWSTNDITGGTLAGLSDDGSCGTLRSSEYYGGAFSSMLADWGVDVNFLIKAELCRDEFSDCMNKFYYGGLSYYWRYPDRYGDVGAYERFSPSGEGCRIEDVTIRFYWNFAVAGSWPLYTTNSELQVWSADALTGLPDTKLFSLLVTPPDYNAVPPVSASTNWFKTFDLSSYNIRFDSDIWFGIESFAPDTLSGFQLLSDNGTFGDKRSAEYFGAFGYMLDDWGLDINFWFSMNVCCVPVNECACAPGGDWPTMGGNFARTGKSGNSIGDAQCKLTKAWEYVAGQVAVFNSPIIYQDTVICYFLDRFAAIDINTGAQIWLRPNDALVIGSAAYSTPTAYNGLVYTAGGAAKAFSALSITTGATVWTRNFSAHSNHFMTFGPSVIVNVGGTDVIIYSDDFGWVYAVNALTGALFPGWAVNPVKLPNAIIRGLTTDGTYIFVGTTIAATSGDVYALDPATGTIVWQLSTSGGLQAATIVPSKDYGGFEGFPNAISVAGTGACEPGANNVLYTCSYYPIASNSSPVQQGGVLYSINAVDGSVNWAILAHNGSGGYSMPNIDASRIIHQSWPYWTTAGDHRGPIGVSRGSGNIEWTNTYPTQPYAADFPLMEGVLTCEPLVPDIFIGVYRSNYAKFFVADNGAPLFHRRFTGYLSGSFSNAGHRVAPVMNDSHLLLTWRNKIIGLTNQVDRPRLDIPNYVIDIPIEFGSPSNYVATFPNAIANSGCVPLQIVSITLDEISNNTTPLSAVVSSANQERLARLSTFVDNFNPKTDNWSLAFANETDLAIDERAYDKGISMNNAAFAPPPYINSIISPLNGSFVAPGDTIDIKLEVNGPMITRGRHAFYAYINTNDPDYFLDSALIDDPNYAIPQIELGVIGGCLYATDRLYFGTASDNYKIIWNSGFVAHGDSASFDVNGEDAQLWQGALVYAISKYRVALHSLNWHGYDNEWKSLLADPECVLDVCPPH
ncbi:MAG: PQQ-binding-like beta-propeller repeat protein, partial [bacterium]